MLKKLSWLWDTAASKEETIIERLNQIIIDQQEQINQLQLQSGTSSINILNPQNQEYYTTQGDIQEVVDSLYELYENVAVRLNQNLKL